MQHNAAFHQGLHSLLRFKQPSETELNHNKTNLPVRQSHTHYINMYGKIRQNIEG